jgi:hypothetical protein
MDNRKELKKEYTRAGTVAGVYKIECAENGRIFLGSSTNAPGLLNSHRFQLEFKAHRNKALQEDWDRFGKDCFTFEVVDMIAKKEDPAVDIKEELTELEGLWREKLAKENKAFYPAR